MISNKWMKQLFSSYRRFKSNRRGYSTENKTDKATFSSNNSTINEIKQPKRKPRRYATKLVLGATIGVVTYQYLYGNEQINKLDQVMVLLKDNNPEVILEGLQSLSNCFVTKLKVFSGEANIRTYPSNDEMESLTHVLMDILINGDPGIRWSAISWIQKFAEENHAVRKCLAKDYVKTLTNKAMNTNVYENKHHEWLIASEILITLLKDEELKKIMQSKRGYLEELISNFESKTTQPMALIVSSEISELIDRKSNIKVVDSGIGHSLIKHSLENNLSPTLKSTGITGASIASVIFFSFIGGAWNDLRNALKFNSSGKGSLKSMLSQRRAYIPLLFAFSADMILQRFLLFSSNSKLEIDEEKIKKFEENSIFESDIMSKSASQINKYLKEVPIDIPLSVAGPMLQNTLFGITTITYLALGRHVFLPMALALAYNHRDYLNSLYAIEYVKDIIEVSKKVKE